MRNLITNYEIDEVNRTITLPKFANLAESNPFTIENIRLIVNETKKQIICSSMQKNNVSVEGNVITLENDELGLDFNDQLTIEVDMGDGITYVDSGDWVINAKLELLNAVSDQTPWVLDEEKARQIKPLVEAGLASSIVSHAFAQAFRYSPITAAYCASWTAIRGAFTLNYAFYGCRRLKLVDFSNVEVVEGDNSLSYAFQNSSIGEVKFDKLRSISSAAYLFSLCHSLFSVNLSALQYIGNADYMFQGSSIAEVVMPNLEKIGSGTRMCEGCTSLRRVEMGIETIEQATKFQYAFSGCSSLQEASFPNISRYSYGSNDFGYTFNGCTALRKFTINCAGCRASSVNDSLIGTATYIKDLYLTGDATSSIYLSWQGSLNFDSVARVLYKLSQNPECGKLVCAFKNINIDDRMGPCDIEYEEGKFVTLEGEDGKGVLQTLYDKVAIKADDDSTANRWNIQNLTINPVE